MKKKTTRAEDLTQLEKDLMQGSRDNRKYQYLGYALATIVGIVVLVLSLTVWN